MSAIPRILFMGLVGLLAYSLPGCDGGPRHAKVSGVVTLDGTPYRGAIVSFQPLGTPDEPNPGRGSYGHTDAQGRFHLRVDDQIEGAVVGKHRVRIVTVQEEASSGVDLSKGTPDGIPKKGPVSIDPIPPEWNANSAIEFSVPPEGTDQANFDIVSRKK